MTPFYNHFFSAAPNSKVDPPEVNNLGKVHVQNNAPAVPSIPVNPPQTQIVSMKTGPGSFDEFNDHDAAFEHRTDAAPINAKHMGPERAWHGPGPIAGFQRPPNSGLQWCSDPGLQ